MVVGLVELLVTRVRSGNADEFGSSVTATQWQGAESLYFWIVYGFT